MIQLELPFPKMISIGPIPLRTRLRIVEQIQVLRERIAEAAKELDKLQWALQRHT